MPHKPILLSVLLYIFAMASMATSIFLTGATGRVIYAIVGMPITVAFSTTGVVIAALGSRRPSG